MKPTVAILALVSALFGVSNAAGAAGPAFARATVNDGGTAGEPGLAIDNRTRTPTIYVVANEAPAPLWKSTNGGRTFKQMAPTTGGGGDADVAVDRKGVVYVSELLDESADGTLPVSTSTNGGRSYQRKVDATTSSDGFDRQWIETNGAGRVLVTAHNITNGRIQGWVSTDYAKTFDGPYTVAENIGIPGPIVAGPRDVYYQAYEGNGAVRFAKSRNGRNWSQDLVARTEGTALFPVIAVDDRSNLYVAWSEDLGFGAETGPVYFTRSTNGGDSWSKPAAISPAGRSAVFPWLVAGAKGRAAVSYVLARQLVGPDFSASLGGPQTTWDLVVAQTTNGVASKPKWTTAVADASIHTGSVCTGGLVLCPGPQQIGVGNYPGPFDRRLLDYFESATDASGRIYTSYQRDRSIASGDPNDVVFSQTDIRLARQVGGTRLR
jgi:hypothetical protein